MIIKETRASGRQKWRQPVIIAGVIALLTAAIVFIISWNDYSRENREEREWLSLYWMRYAASYYEFSGQWSDFSERLLADVGRYPSKRPFRLSYIDAQGIVIAQVIRDSQGARVAKREEVHTMDGAQEASLRQEAQQGSKPIIVHGQIVGYIDAENDAGRSPDAYVWWSTIAAAIGIYVLLIQWQVMAGRSHRGQIRALTEQAKQVGHMNGDRHVHGRGHLSEPEPKPKLERSAPYEALYVELERVRMRVQQLETVRRSMVADIAHELRTPLSVMRTQLDNALQAGGELIPAQTAALYDETVRMSKLVHDLQELALAETGHLPLNKTWFSLPELAGSVIEMLSVEAEDLGLKLISQVKCEVRLYGDQGRIRQALINLVGNALRHARGQVRIVIGLQGDHAHVAISDDGWGIEEDELPHIFERFYRGQTSSSTFTGKSGKRSGLGLGLAIAEQYARAHDGGIEVTSSWGEGATFMLTLPIING